MSKTCKGLFTARSTGWNRAIMVVARPAAAKSARKDLMHSPTPSSASSALMQHALTRAILETQQFKVLLVRRRL
jgi:hypothetical protein